jgi:hypothetical protein
MSEPDNKQEQPKPNGNGMFDVLINKQVSRQNEKHPTYQPGEARLYDPNTNPIF